jgi:hypothetical protein
MKRIDSSNHCNYFVHSHAILDTHNQSLRLVASTYVICRRDFCIVARTSVTHTHAQLYKASAFIFLRSIPAEKKEESNMVFPVLRSHCPREPARTTLRFANTGRRRRLNQRAQKPGPKNSKDSPDQLWITAEMMAAQDCVAHASQPPRRFSLTTSKTLGRA